MNTKHEISFSDQQLEKVFNHPISEFLNRPGKNMRGMLFNFSVQWLGFGTMPDPKLIQCGLSLIEQIHAGSLIIDDIQDQTLVRRGQPSLHLEVGDARAINIGNALYFLPLLDVRNSGFNLNQEVLLYRHIHQTFVEAHLGQALDLSTCMSNVPQKETAQLCEKVADMKTGALAELAVQIAAISVGTQTEKVDELAQFGRTFGRMLQGYNDIYEIKNMFKTKTLPADLKFQRPSLIWRVAADCLREEEYEEWIGFFKSSPLDLGSVQNFIFLNELLEKAKYLVNFELSGSLENLLPIHPVQCEIKTKFEYLIKQLESSYEL